VLRRAAGWFWSGRRVLQGEDDEDPPVVDENGREDEAGGEQRPLLVEIQVDARASPLQPAFHRSADCAAPHLLRRGRPGLQAALADGKPAAAETTRRSSVVICLEADATFWGRLRSAVVHDSMCSSPFLQPDRINDDKKTAPNVKMCCVAHLYREL